MPVDGQRMCPVTPLRTPPDAKGARPPRNQRAWTYAAMTRKEKQRRRRGIFSGIRFRRIFSLPRATALVQDDVVLSRFRGTSVPGGRYLITGFGTAPILHAPLEAFTGCCRCETACTQAHSLYFKRPPTKQMRYPVKAYRLWAQDYSWMNLYPESGTYSAVIFPLYGTP